MFARPDRRTALAGLVATLVPLRGEAAPAPGGNVLKAQATPVRLLPGSERDAETWSFEGLSGPPVLRGRPGEELRVTLRNGTPKPLGLHWHGVRGVPAADGTGGLSRPPVPPGGSGTYAFTPLEPGTSLIRPLLVGGSSEPGGRGLAGMLVVAEPDPPPVDADLALLVRDWLLEPSGALAEFGRPEEAALAGRLGNRLAVAGADAPNRVELPPGSRVRLRLANGCNARIFRIRFDGLRAFVGAVDGQPTDTFEPLRSTLPFGPGSRYDIFVDVPREPGVKGALTALVGPGVSLVEVVAGSGPAVTERPPVPALPPNRALPPEIKLQNAVRKEITLAGGARREATGAIVYPTDPARMWTLNDAVGVAGAPPLFTARRGQPVVLGITNSTAFPQPLHLHGHVFRLLHALDDGWEPWWFDTIQVAEGKTVHIAFLAETPGRWPLSSTVLERFDAGLWTTYEVV